MKKEINEFFNLFGNGLVIISLMLAAYMILINLYHYNDVNYQLQQDLSSNDSYVYFKNKVVELETKIAKTRSIADSNINHHMITSSAEAQITRCLAMIKESKYYNIDKTFFNQKDIYDYNVELLSSLQNQCIFMTNLYTTNAIKDYGGVKNNYAPVSESILSKRDNINYYSNYVKNTILGNTKYEYSTSMFRTTIYNNVSEYNRLTIYNYKMLINAVEELTNWYIVEAGGTK